MEVKPVSRKSQNTATISISFPYETLSWLEDFCLMKAMNRSGAIRYLVRMGRTYLTLLEEQEKLQNANGAKDGE